MAVLILTSSTYNSFGKELATALSPFTILVLSEALTAFFVVLAFGFLPTLNKVLMIRMGSIVPLLALGIMNGAVAPYIFFKGLSLTTAVNAELFSRMEMVALLILAIAILREEHLTRVHVIAGSVILSGILFVALRGFEEAFTLQIGDILLIVSTFIFASGSIIYKKFLKDIPPEVVIVSRATTAACIFLIVIPFIGHPLLEELHSFPVVLIPALMGFAFISRFLNLFSFYEAIERLPVSIFSMFSTVNIVGGVLFAALYLGERIYWYHLIGGALIVLGALLLEILGIHPTEKSAEEHLRQHR